MLLTRSQGENAELLDEEGPGVWDLKDPRLALSNTHLGPQYAGKTGNQEGPGQEPGGKKSPGGAFSMVTETGNVGWMDVKCEGVPQG